MRRKFNILDFGAVAGKDESTDTTFIHAGKFAKTELENVTLNHNRSANLINSWDKDAAKKIKTTNLKRQGNDSDLIAYPETPFECRPI